MSDTASELPAGWARVSLFDAAIPRGEKASPASYPAMPFIGMDHVEPHSGRIIGSVPAGTMKSAAARFGAGDVLYGRLRPYLNKVAIPSFDGLASAEFIVFPSTEFLSSSYLAYRLRASDFVSFASHLNEGDRPRVDFSQIGAFNLDVPPNREQHRIVAKIEELFSELDNAVESLTVARAQLKTYRQALLRAAFEGKLTSDWRAANPKEVEPPEILIARVRAEREARHKQALDDWQTAFAEWRAGGEVGPKPPKPRRPRDLSGGTTCVSGDAPWPAVELGDVIAVSSGEFLTSADMRAGPHPVYGGNGIAGYHDEWLLSDPTLVIGRVGAKCGVTHITLPNAWVTDNALIVRPLISSFDMRFFKYLLEYMNLNALGSSTGQPVISGSKIYGQIIALPSKAEQVVAANLIEASDTAVQSTDGEIGDALARIAALRQSILKQAFSGQLVPQDPTDEPATVLLARLREEPPAPRTRRRKTA